MKKFISLAQKRNIKGGSWLTGEILFWLRINSRWELQVYLSVSKSTARAKQSLRKLKHIFSCMVTFEDYQNALFSVSTFFLACSLWPWSSASASCSTGVLWGCTQFLSRLGFDTEIFLCCFLMLEGGESHKADPEQCGRRMLCQNTVKKRLGERELQSW